ncbi:hypothetical protein FZI85_09400 [Mycobacterium sp. CBMA293]|uniref:hypothetical protein n=1 Tax=unclassified Mycolicibacterium TaxID=2636767 RepID=UPI0012DDB9C4|nr:MULTISPECIES: hypothetical protein [unclassified Mycolicibacterium]MUL46194.1 hypothetical protein [Mycolicibacterium sp. CBMA 360]MUL58756.1 hypothetical protein [Mycolicibacterium sp. CBMA 335]MUL69150.1 hypothetical protein [Mycolicibacterium sp. CBMA 311]MUL94114.1 hypothetical protein [Mycolicibacterium sp. CBMA 230]MUM05126.1 hypothetical protein [Mycolicibacterium sp. CBMA 213]
MKSLRRKAVGTGLVQIGAVVAALSFSGVPSAAADPVIPRPGDASAEDTINALEASGYDTEVQFLTGPPNVPLSACKVTAIHNPDGSTASPGRLSTVYVDVSCPNAK